MEESSLGGTVGQNSTTLPSCAYARACTHTSTPPPPPACAPRPPPPAPRVCARVRTSRAGWRAWPRPCRCRSGRPGWGPAPLRGGACTHTHTCTCACEGSITRERAAGRSPGLFSANEKSNQIETERPKESWKQTANRATNMHVWDAVPALVCMHARMGLLCRQRGRANTKADCAPGLKAGPLPPSP